MNIDKKAETTEEDTKRETLLRYTAHHIISLSFSKALFFACEKGKNFPKIFWSEEKSQN